jgi:hypothetical protein
MQQRQLRLGDILDDYCTRERRLTNHAVVAMVGSEVKQTRCTTCDTEHEYKHARVPRQRRKADSPAALYAQVAAGAPKRVTGHPASAVLPGPEAQEDEHADDLDVAEASQAGEDASLDHDEHADDSEVKVTLSSGDSRRIDREAADVDAVEADDEDRGDGRREGDEAHRGDEGKEEEGPVHRRLIRASLPREAQPPAARPIPEFTIRQPGNRPGRFRPRHQRGGQPFQGDRVGGNGFSGPRNASHRHGGSRPPHGSAPRARRHGPGRKRSK